MSDKRRDRGIPRPNGKIHLKAEENKNNNNNNKEILHNILLSNIRYINFQYRAYISVCFINSKFSYQLNLDQIQSTIIELGIKTGDSSSNPGPSRSVPHRLSRPKTNPCLQLLVGDEWTTTEKANVGRDSWNKDSPSTKCQ